MDAQEPVRAFSTRAAARLADGTFLGEVFVILYRNFEWPDEPGVVQDLEWWGYLEWSTPPEAGTDARIQQEPLLIVDAPSTGRSIPVRGLCVQTIFGLPGRYLVAESDPPGDVPEGADGPAGTHP